MVELIFSLVIGLAAYLLARRWAAQLGLDPKPRGALVLAMTLAAGIVADALARLFT
jgi:hypothetical protein